MATATLRGAGVQTTSGGGSLPTGTVSGDLVVSIAYRNAATAPTLPANWTSPGETDVNPSILVAWRIYDGSWTMPTFTNAQNVHTFAFQGGTFDTGGPIGAISFVGPTANATVTWPAFDTTVDDDSGAVFRGVVKARINSMPTPTGHTLRLSSGTQPAFFTFTANDSSDPAQATSNAGRNDAHTIVQFEVLGAPEGEPTPAEGSDSAEGADAASLLATITQAESSTGADAGALTTTAPASDSASGEEAQEVAVALSVADSGTGSDSADAVDQGSGEPTPVEASDSGSGDEGAALAADAPGNDSAAGSEAAGLQAVAGAEDAGAGDEAAAVAAAVTESDASSGAEDAGLAAEVSGFDASEGSDSAEVDVLDAGSPPVEASDDGSGSAAAEVTVTLAVADAGSGEDSADAIGDQVLEVADGAAATDFASVAGEGAGVVPTGPWLEPKLVFSSGEWSGPPPQWLRQQEAASVDVAGSHDTAAVRALAGVQDAAAAAAEAAVRASAGVADAGTITAAAAVLGSAGVADAATACGAIQIRKFDPDAEMLALVLTI